MGVIDDTFLKYYQILTALRRGSLGPVSAAQLGLSLCQVRFQFVLSNLALANRNLPAIIWCFASRTRLASEQSRIDVSVSAVRYRALVFAAPQYFVAGNRLTECRGAVSVGAVSSVRGDATQILTVPSRGVSCIGSQGKQTRDGRMILSDEAKGVSL